ncbi:MULTISPECIES: GAP family protein [unclassified Mycolicibacterium]|uniref:GAP family protein n=1 Tax=unclassified Mycolicibacterium TaxID=2636767 RepID=UPI0012DDA073|nr:MULTISPECIES: GAP family protein [unclassified Mycolicibacterium]MUL83972.1 GAP family protein [Mycolicibacterium sp. CBMA 329]MUL89962.1 GAP family protein [Mycolicibacterium sp. CBMA 331]MUL98017.1 GAP family protein [Mycolicibacterium sp. CBMA 334]MUM30251.1 GAP family protein [Mycolicibacterium sp. CBMA 295]MUM39477.1 GAP family protein [Mycolicibacterium sp. CBMA 247]
MAVLALLTTINPVRLGLILLVLSRPRPMQNLLAYWTGALTVGLLTLLIPLVVLHATPASASFANSFAHPTTSPVAQRSAIGVGAVLLLLALVLVVQSFARAPSRSAKPPTPHPDGTAKTSTLLLDSSVPPILRRLLHPEPDAQAEAGSPVRRMLGKARGAWRSGSPWISFVIGVIFLPPLDGVFFALGIVIASGASTGIQFVAIIAFVIGVLTVEEIILVSNLFAPGKTQAVLRQVHDWARTHHRKFAAAILAVVGLSLVARGMGGL